MFLKIKTRVFNSNLDFYKVINFSAGCLLTEFGSYILEHGIFKNGLPPLFAFTR